MRLLYETDGYYRNVNYDRVDVLLIKDDFKRGLESAIYIDGDKAVCTDIKNFDLLEKLYYKIADKNTDECKWVNLNRAWNNILKKEEEKRRLEEEKERLSNWCRCGYMQQ